MSRLVTNQDKAPGCTVSTSGPPRRDLQGAQTLHWGKQWIDTLLTCVRAKQGQNFNLQISFELFLLFIYFLNAQFFFEDLGGKYKIWCVMTRSSYYPKCCQKIVVWFNFPPCTLVWEWLLWLQITFIITTKLWDTSCLSPPVSVIPSQKLWQMSLLPFWKT